MLLTIAWMLSWATGAQLFSLEQPAGGAPTVRLEKLSGETVLGVLLDSEPGALRVRAEGQPVSLPEGELVLLWVLEASDGSGSEAGTEPDSLPAEASDSEPAADLLMLASRSGVPGTGDRLWGRLEGGDEFGLVWRLAAGQRLELPFDDVDRLLPGVDRPVDRLLELASSEIDDRLYRRRPDGGLDGVTGVLARMDGRQMVLESALGDLSFEADDVLALVLAATEHPARQLPGWPVRVRLVGGSLFEAALQGVAGGRFRLATQFAEELLLPIRAVSSMLLRVPAEGGVQLLADLEPTAVREWSALGGDDAVLYSWRRDLSVSGRPLRVGGALHTTGLGVHANAQLAYEVPAGVDRLRVSVGLIDEVLELPAEASVSFEVRVDGVPVVTTEVLREGQPPLLLRVSGLEAGQTLELLTLDGGDLDAGDRAAWVDGVFLPSR
jgi:hypothetical protein